MNVTETLATVGGILGLGVGLALLQALIDMRAERARARVEAEKTTRSPSAAGSPVSASTCVRLIPKDPAA